MRSGYLPPLLVTTPLSSEGDQPSPNPSSPLPLSFRQEEEEEEEELVLMVVVQEELQTVTFLATPELHHQLLNTPPQLWITRPSLLPKTQVKIPSRTRPQVQLLRACHPTPNPLPPPRPHPPSPPLLLSLQDTGNAFATTRLP